MDENMIEVPEAAVLGAFNQPPDPNFQLPVANMSGVNADEVWRELSGSDRQVIAAFSNWASESHPMGTQTRQGGLFHRDRYVTPTTIAQQMRVAYAAVEEDDIVGGVAETTEALAFSLVSFVSDDEDDQDIYNQIAADIDLDSRLREIWRELFTASQVVVAVWWDEKTYTVRGETSKGNARRKKYENIRVPVDITILDPLKIVPIGTTIFGKERLAYQAGRAESERFADIMSSQHEAQDEIVERLIVKDPRSQDGRYVPDKQEAKEITEAGFDPTHLWLLNPNNVFRHTLTRSSYQRWAPLRMRSVFELLDLKHQLRQMERAHLIGGTNFIVLITKGSDQLPAHPSEITNLQTQVKVVSRTPILVGDHRLKVEIVTPKLDNTLHAERFNTLDSRITARLFQMFQLGNYAAGAAGDDSAKLIKVVARGLESRRHMIRRTLEKHILKPMFDMNNDATEFSKPPKLLFHPRAIALDFDSAWASFLLQLRQDREISRDTILSQFDMDQPHEYLMLKREADKYDDTFKSKVAFSGPGDPKGPFDPQTGQPVDAPAPTNQRDNGGGRRNGGGAAPGTGQGQPARNPQKRSDKGRKKPPVAASDTASEVTITVTDAEGNILAQGAPMPGVDAVALVGEAQPFSLEPQEGPDA